VVSPLLANVCLHELDEWYVRTYRVRPEWAHLATRSLTYRRRKEIGGTLMFTRYADDWVAVWNGSRTRAEEIKAEFKAFLADELKLRLSEEKTFITHIDDGFDFLGYVRHEVAYTAVMTPKGGHNLVCCHQYPTQTCGWSNPAV